MEYGILLAVLSEALDELHEALATESLEFLLNGCMRLQLFWRAPGWSTSLALEIINSLYLFCKLRLLGIVDWLLMSWESP